MNDLKARRARADALAATGAVDAAIEEYDTIARAYAATGLALRAIGVCKRILELDPHHRATLCMLADLCAQRARPLDDELGDPITLDPDEAQLVAALPPPLPPDTDDDAIDLDACAAALTPRAARSLALERHADVPLFSGLPPEGFRALVEQLLAWQADDGALIVAEGEAADSVFVVVRGAARVDRGGVELATLGAGAFFGEMALLSRKPRMASVHAVGATELLELPRAVLEDLAARDPRVQQALERFCRARLIDNLARCSPLFAGVDGTAARRALSSFAARKLPAGAVVVEQGIPSPGLFIVLEGCLEVAASVGTERTPLRLLGPGEVFGEMSLLSDDGAAASVATTAPSTVLVLPRVAFAELVLAVPTVRARLELLAAQRRAHNDALLPDASDAATLL
ncbi:MAG: cyclic nucleotide-binding domain-containing protein [Deltaproteobacteria bacterium]|nr:cyclic nucleotide-binding domain-containing protein [Deltaproteobacteria bacterium]